MDDSLRLDFLEQVAMELDVKIRAGENGFELQIGQTSGLPAADLRAAIDRAMEAIAG